jgi:glycosyltransferase involved in cell wall biosynthesis
MKLSVVIITFNEEKHIRRCLESVQDIADEIIVVDSFSTDKTEEICAEFHTTFLQQQFLGYKDQKNLALDTASNDFVLSLDADEALSSELKMSILQEKEKRFETDAYVMNRSTFLGTKLIKHGTWYPDSKLRLINRKKGRWSGINVHEKIEMDSSVSVKKIKGDILHYSYNNFEEIIVQNNKYTSIQAKAMFERGKKAPAYKLVLNPLVAFINGYIFKLGFLDGLEGFFIASSVAYQTMVKYAKLRKLHQLSPEQLP